MRTVRRLSPPLALGLALASAATGCRSTYPIDSAVLEHDAEDVTTVYFRDGMVREAHAIPIDGGTAWLISRPIPKDRVEKTVPGDPIGAHSIRRATLHMRDGSQLDGLIVTDAWTGEPDIAVVETYPSSALSAVTALSPGTGFVSGLLLGPLAGLAGGGLLGGLLGAATGDPADEQYDPENCLLFCSPGAEGFVMGAALGFFGGLLFGPLVGAIRGNGTVYGEIPDRPDGAGYTLSILPTRGGATLGLWGTF